MQFSENKPPATNQNKALWLFEDMARASKFYGSEYMMTASLFGERKEPQTEYVTFAYHQVPLNPLANFRPNTFFAQSTLRLISLESPNDLNTSIQAFFEALWHHDIPVDTSKAIEEILIKANISLKGGRKLKD